MLITTEATLNPIAVLRPVKTRTTPQAKSTDDVNRFAGPMVAGIIQGTRDGDNPESEAEPAKTSRR